MNPSTVQDHPKSAQQTGKHSVESGSPSSTNIDSEVAGVLGTPIVVDMSDSATHVANSNGEKASKVVEQMELEPVQGSGREQMMTDERKPLTSKPALKRRLVLPERIICNILDHTFRLTMLDPIHTPLSKVRPPWWRIVFHQQRAISVQFDYRWKILQFATWLRDVQTVDEAWSATVENHPFWAIFLSQRPTFIRDGDRGSSRRREPTWHERAQPGRKEPKIHSSLQAEAENTCWICVLHHGPIHMPFPPAGRLYMETTPFRAIPVCDAHWDIDICHCCLQIENEVDPLNLCNPDDYESFQIDDVAGAAVCERCRVDAVQKALDNYPIRFQAHPLLSAVHYHYVRSGRHTALRAVENLYATWFAWRYLELEDEYTEAMKRWKSELKADLQKRRLAVPSFADVRLPMDRVADLLENSVQASIDHMIDEGRWMSPRTLNDRLKQALSIGVDWEDALPAIHVFSPALTDPTKRTRLVTLTKDWPIQDRPAPPCVVRLMERDYAVLLSERVDGALKNLRTMIAKISNGDMDIAEAKATSIGPEELLAWLNDPRNHIKNWWNSQPFLKPITSTDIARAFGSTSPESESGTKRKRDDEDVSASQKADKLAKTEERITSVEPDADLKMDVIPVTPTAAGPPTPQPEGSVTITAPVSEEMQVSLATLTPERINRLPWPVPQQVLTVREAEYLRMTDFDKNAAQWDSLYSVPASISELDEFTSNMLMEVWHKATKAFSICRCEICQRARAYEKEVAAAENNANISQYVSLITSDVRIEDMTDHQRSWLANQASLLHSAVTIPEEHYSPVTEGDNDLDRYDELDSDEAYDLMGTEEDEAREASEGRPEDDVSYDIPGARLQENRR